MSIIIFIRMEKPVLKRGLFFPMASRSARGKTGDGEQEEVSSMPQGRLN
jgi:hypothetical protein